MFDLGQYQQLKIVRQTPPGLYLVNDEGEEVLLPNKYIPENFEVGEEIDVFVYLDHEERPVATTLKPFITVNDFGYLRCVETSEIGAFLDWGLEKQLFVPFRQQAFPMKKGMWFLVYCYLDKETNRLAASSKVHQFLDNSVLEVVPFEKVDLIVSNPTDLGYNVIINKKHLGLVFQSDVFQGLQPGDRLEGWIKKIREDHKIDVVLQRPGYRSIEPNADKILEVLEANDGFLPLHDKSPAAAVQETLEMSKKSFKRAVGTLYKKHLIRIVDGKGIYRQ